MEGAIQHRKEKRGREQNGCKKLEKKKPKARNQISCLEDRVTLIERETRDETNRIE